MHQTRMIKKIRKTHLFVIILHSKHANMRTINVAILARRRIDLVDVRNIGNTIGTYNIWRSFFFSTEHLKISCNTKRREKYLENLDSSVSPIQNHVLFQKCDIFGSVEQVHIYRERESFSLATKRKYHHRCICRVAEECDSQQRSSRQRMTYVINTVAITTENLLRH
jgi:hypothetical protein